MRTCSTKVRLSAATAARHRALKAVQQARTDVSSLEAPLWSERSEVASLEAEAAAKSLAVEQLTALQAAEVQQQFKH